MSGLPTSSSYSTTKTTGIRKRNRVLSDKIKQLGLSTLIFMLSTLLMFFKPFFWMSAFLYRAREWSPTYTNDNSDFAPSYKKRCWLLGFALITSVGGAILSPLYMMVNVFAYIMYVKELILGGDTSSCIFDSKENFFQSCSCNLSPGIDPVWEMWADTGNEGPALSIAVIVSCKSMVSLLKGPLFIPSTISWEEISDYKISLEEELKRPRL